VLLEFQAASSGDDARIPQIHKLIASKTESLRLLAPASEDAKKIKEAEELLKKIVAKVPHFKPHHQADVFYRSFEIQAKTYRLPTEELKARAFRDCLHSSNLEALNWFDGEFPELSRATLKDIKSKFFKHFLPFDWESLRFDALIATTYRIGETVPAFINRFIKVARSNDWSWNHADSNSTLALKLLYHKVPTSVKQSLNGKTVTDFKFPSQLADELMKFPGVPKDVQPVAHICSGCHQQLSCNSCKPKPKSKDWG
jgi:hypothetical protein